MRRVAPRDDRLCDALVHEIHRALVHERTDDRLRVERVARRQRLGSGDELLQELFVDATLDDDLAGVEADLTLVEERPERRHAHGVVDIDIVEDHHRVVPTDSSTVRLRVRPARSASARPVLTPPMRLMQRTSGQAKNSSAIGPPAPGA